MIFKIAWRNIWRNKIRSFTVMGSVLVGVWALIFVLSFTAGFINSYISSAIANEISHIQFHNPKFVDEKEVQYTLEHTASIKENLSRNPMVKAFATRTINSGMLSTARGSRGIQIRGVVPAEEVNLTHLNEKLVEGVYLDASKSKNAILVSRRLADKMKLKLKSKPILSFQKEDGSSVPAAFKVVGIYELGNAVFEESNVFVRQSDLNRLMGAENLTHEVALLLHHVEDLDTVKSALAAAFPTALVQNYKEIAPNVNLYESQMSVSIYAIIFIVMLALIFGIINTMLMAVLERTKELGMLMAVGMKRLQVFTMIVLETLFLAMIAAPIGLFLGYLTVVYYGNKGIDLSAYGKGMDKFGFSDHIYLSLDVSSFITVTIAVGITAILAALYPALKATRLKPIEAMRTV
ncbi:MAG: ABC-type transport system, involved in lipoprotein release, permease component [uncultured Aureispira sp.]|uniref:ABC-type transport system, involved in lipoprotein release, permease component n=1 Tax=uncultured Aureispira sp. TaxID=1331704 RepID=A0A6S6UIE1_9BACT|nr:MAG: ABC-type transport system, involved in lipoprotein release, permease component [uncultured Aureispira sp.]